MERTPGARPKARATASASRLNHLPQRIEACFGHRLRQRRMGMDREINLFDCELVRARDDELVNQLRRVSANDVRTEYFAVLRVANDLHEALGLARRPRSAARRE